LTRAQVTDLGGGTTRITHPLPWALDHVHCYAVAGDDGLTLIDSGLGTPGTAARWRAVLDDLGRPRVARVVVTHYHPDHIGCSAELSELAGGAEIVQGAHDWALTAPAFGDARVPGAFEAHLRRMGMPDAVAADSATDEDSLPIRFRRPDRLVDEGDVLELAGEPFHVLVLPGHADGHIALYGERSGRMFGGDVILNEITPNVGLWEDTTSGDPLSDYLASLERIAALAPAVVYPGHRTLVDDAVGRAGEIRAHHAARLDAHELALRQGAASPYEVGLRIWGGRLGFHERRFALVEAAAHLVRLVALGRAVETTPMRFAPA
jgi:glyoxylase-like metal-dependent hydrolase (beta-lactamase superfamily II)